MINNNNPQKNQNKLKGKIKNLKNKKIKEKNNILHINNNNKINMFNFQYNFLSKYCIL